jgi:hypothetical protein
VFATSLNNPAFSLKIFASFSFLMCPMTGSTAARRRISRWIWGVTPLLFGSVDLELVFGRRIVAAISGIGVNSLDLVEM